MGINIKRVFTGGLAAGLIIITSAVLMVPAVGNEMDAALARFNLPPMSAAAIAFFGIVSLTTGMMLVWLYAALQPRFKPGIRTSMIAALIIWIPGCLFANVAMIAYGFMPVKLTVIGTLWGLAELIIGAAVGSRLYSDTSSPDNAPTKQPTL